MRGIVNGRREKERERKNKRRREGGKRWELVCRWRRNREKGEEERRKMTLFWGARSGVKKRQ